MLHILINRLKEFQYTSTLKEKHITNIIGLKCVSFKWIVTQNVNICIDNPKQTFLKWFFNINLHIVKH